MTQALPVVSPRILETLLANVPSALFVLDADGRVTYANAPAAGLVGRTPEAVLGCEVAREFAHLLTERWGQACHTARSEQRTVEYEIHNVALAGWFRLCFTPVDDCLVVHVKDTTELNRMTQLQQLSSALATCTTPEEVIAVTLEGAVNIMGASLGAIYEPNGQDLKPIGDAGYQGLPEAGTKAPSFTDPSPPFEALTSRRPVFLAGEALDRQTAFRQRIDPATRSLAALPLLVEGRALGVLVLNFRAVQAFEGGTQQFMLALAVQCAQALDRVRGREVIDDSRQRLAFLAVASAVLTASLDIDETLRRLGGLAVENMADWATVFLADENGGLQLKAAVHRDPHQLPLLNALMEHYALNPDKRHGAVQVYLTGRSSLLSTVPAEVIGAVEDENKRELLRRLKVESLITVPLTTRGRVIGAMAFVSSDLHRRYSPADLELAEELARRAAGTIENAQLFLAAQDGEARLAGIIGTVTDAVMTSDEQGHLILFNAASERMFGVDASEALGQPVDRFRPTGPDGAPVPFQLGTTADQRLFAVRTDGLSVPVEETTSEVVVRGQRLFTSVFRDLTEGVQTAQTLLESEARFRSTFEQAAVGIAHVGLDGRWQSVNQRLCDIVGFSREELLERSFPEMTYEDDLEQDLEYVGQLRSGKIRTYSMRKRYYSKGGGLVWVNITGSLMRDSGGEAQYLIKVVEDISDIKRAEEQLSSAREDLERRVEERTGDLQRLSEELQVQVRELELRNTEAKVLSEMGEMLQACFSLREVEQVVAQHIAQLFPGMPGKLYAYGASKNGLEELVFWNGGSSSTFLFGPEECWGLRRGRLFSSVGGGLTCQHHQATGATLCVPMLAQGETVGLLYLEGNSSAFTGRQERLAQTAAETVALAMVNLRLRETLRQQSIRDPLTGLFNRRYLEETFERELRRAERKDECLGIVMLDVDLFKMFNDTHGHEAGDALLKALGGLLKDSVRAEDVACRFGGEEFTLLLSGATPQQTFDRAEQVREAISRLKVMNQGELLEGVSASMGVATFPQHGRELAGLVRAADLALYRAKREGRNRVINAE